MNIIEVWTDGGSRNNGRKDAVGGYGVVLKYGDYKKELYEGFVGVTNNQMELKGVVVALENIKTTHIPIKIYLDSAYVANGINNWVKNWKKRGWKKGDGREPENLELWKRLDKLVSMQDNIKFIKVKGHADNEGNNRADELANIAMDEVDT